MKKNSEIKLLESWLKKDGNSKLKLAMALGYKTPNTIDKWLSIKRIPDWNKENVLKIIGGE